VEHVADGGELDENDRTWGIHAAHSVGKNPDQTRKFIVPAVSGQAQFVGWPPPPPRGLLAEAITHAHAFCLEHGLPYR
jgi:hypothetical protein